MTQLERIGPVTARIYLDHAATTPLLPAAREAMAEGFARWANPSSPHAEGRAAKAALEAARGQVAAAYGWAGEVLFTGGASESLRIALTRGAVERRLASAVEHDAVLRAAYDIALIPGRGGRSGDVGQCLDCARHERFIPTSVRFERSREARGDRDPVVQ